jgi:hypothetical protein
MPQLKKKYLLKYYVSFWSTSDFCIWTSYMIVRFIKIRLKWLTSKQKSFFLRFLSIN